jgi:K(+)-stimulated pyrophosphate-energized sodium pump
MNLVALLIAPEVVALTFDDNSQHTVIRLSITAIAVLVIVTSVVISKRRPIAVGEEALVAG